MTEADKQELYRLVRGWLMSPGWPETKHVRAVIQDAHMGRLDEWLVDTSNMYLFRLYRNHVSHSPDRLMAEALAFTEDD